MTLPSALSDLLILAPSFSLSPVAPVLSALSEPITQTNKNLKHLTLLTHYIKSMI